MRRGHKSILIQLATGGGKTAIASYMLKRAAEKGHTAFFNCHRRELIKQSLSTLDKFDVPCGTIAAGWPYKKFNKVFVASVPSLGRRLKRVPKPYLIFWDEAHYIGAKTWTNIFKSYPDAFHVLLTATPTRLDGKALGNYASAMVRGPSMRTLIDQGHLADYKIYAPSKPDLSGVRRQMGDFRKSDLDDILMKPTIVGNALNEYKKFCSGKKAVAFCVSRKHSRFVVDCFNQSGIAAKHVDGETPTFERDQAIRDFAAGKIKVMSNVDLFGCGFDLPSMEAIIGLRPTQSLSLYLQQAGRVLRPAPNKKHAIILDHVGNVERHGLPDEDREWSLKGRSTSKNSKQELNTPVRICQSCFAAQHPTPVCKYCGVPFEVKHREVDEVDGELSEIDTAKFKRKARSEQGKAQTLDDLYKLGKQRGYKNPRGWAKHIFNARQRKRLGV
jgi:superfamily II DNA or RNA helicase